MKSSRSFQRSAKLPAFLSILVLLATVGIAFAIAKPWGDTGSAPNPNPSSSISSSEPSPPANGEDSSASASPTEPAPPPEPAIFTIGAVGDVLPHDTVIRTAREDAGTGADYDFQPMLAATAEWSQGVDLALCNLEVPLVEPSITPSGYPLFGAPLELAQDLAQLGWDGCSTGTNHTLDRGASQAFHTLDQLDAAGLGHAGSARTDEEKNSPQIYELTRDEHTIRVAQIGATYGTNGLPIPTDAPWVVSLLDDGTELIELAQSAREDFGADLVVATIHWGEEYQLQANAEQRELAQRFADSGTIDLIIGTHPHVPQEYEFLDGGPRGDGMWVAYSLGNFISNQDELCCRTETAVGLFMTATIEKSVDKPARVIDLEWTPMTVDRVGRQRVYSLLELAHGEVPTHVALSPSQISDRLARVESIMELSRGKDFGMRTDPSQPTGTAPVVLSRSFEQQISSTD